MMHYVYLLKTRQNPTRHYVGFTANLKTRLASHNAGQNHSTAANRPWILAGYFAFPDEQIALAFEQYLKSGSGRTFAKRHFF
jgi:predicted GIY-YIG superfamily endonuclease